MSDSVCQSPIEHTLAGDTGEDTLASSCVRLGVSPVELNCDPRRLVTAWSRSGTRVFGERGRLSPRISLRAEFRVELLDPGVEESGCFLKSREYLMGHHQIAVRLLTLLAPPTFFRFVGRDAWGVK